MDILHSPSGSISEVPLNSTRVVPRCNFQEQDFKVRNKLAARGEGVKYLGVKFTSGSRVQLYQIDFYQSSYDQSLRFFGK